MLLWAFSCLTVYSYLCVKMLLIVYVSRCYLSSVDIKSTIVYNNYLDRRSIAMDITKVFGTNLGRCEKADRQKRLFMLSLYCKQK